MRIAPKAAVLVALALVAPVVSSAPLRAAPKQTITLSAPSTVILPRPVVFHGKVTNAKPGQKVALQILTGTWNKLQSTTLDAHLAYSFTVHFSYPTTYKFRAVSANAIQSNAVTVVLQNWMYLSDIPMSVNAGTVTCPTTAVIGGKSFAHSCTIKATTGTTAEVEWNMSTGCSRLQGTFGITDNSASEADATLSVRTDNQTIFSHTYGSGASTLTTVNIAARKKRLRIDAIQSQPASGDVFVGLGNARVLCRWRWGP